MTTRSGSEASRLVARGAAVRSGRRRRPNRRCGNMPRRWSIALLLALFVRTFFVQAFKIPSGSMLPTLQIGDHILVSKLAYGIRMPILDDENLVRFGTPQPGDVIVFVYPVDPSKDFIKRVIGRPGDVIRDPQQARLRQRQAKQGSPRLLRRRRRRGRRKLAAGQLRAGDRAARPFLRHGRQPRSQLRWPVLGVRRPERDEGARRS